MPDSSGFRLLANTSTFPSGHWNRLALHNASGMAEGVYEREVQFLLKEIKEFAAFMENLVHKKIDWDRFSEDIDASMDMDSGMVFHHR